MAVVEGRGDIQAAVERLIAGQAITTVRLSPADGTGRQNSTCITKKHWDYLRALAAARGLVVPEDRVQMGRQEAAQLAAVLKGSSPRTEQERLARDAMLKVIWQGGGLLVAGVTETPQTGPTRSKAKASAPAPRHEQRHAGWLVTLEPCQMQSSDLRRVTIDAEDWAILCQMGSTPTDDTVIRHIDAVNLARAIRRGLDAGEGPRQDALTQASVWNVVALLEQGGGVVVTRRRRT